MGGSALEPPAVIPSFPLFLFQARPPAQENFYRAAAQLKLLLDVPEKVWGAVEAGRYLPAARLHLLGGHLRRQLQLDVARARSSPVLARFPILLRQVAAANHLRWAGVGATAWLVLRWAAGKQKKNVVRGRRWEAGRGCPGKWWMFHLWKCSKAGWMGSEQIDLVEGVPAKTGGLELDDFEGAFQPKAFNGSMVYIIEYISFLLSISGFWKLRFDQW